MKSLFNVKLLLTLSVLVVAIYGCTGTQVYPGTRTEQLLGIAGFKKKVAVTPEQIEHLKGLDQKRITKQKNDGESHYIYADAEGCMCMYVGDKKAYKEFSRIRTQQVLLP